MLNFIEQRPDDKKNGNTNVPCLENFEPSYTKFENVRYNYYAHAWEDRT